jgi:hypothetical protein
MKHIKIKIKGSKMENNLIKHEDTAGYSMYTHQQECIDGALNNLKTLPKISAIEKDISPMDIIMWTYAIELTTDDLVIFSCWDTYELEIDDICKGFVEQYCYHAATILPIFSYDKSTSLLKILILIGHKNYDFNIEDAKKNPCLNFKFHRQFRGEYQSYVYTPHKDSIPTNIFTDGINKVIDRYKCDGEIHYLPSRAQLPFTNAIDLANYQLKHNPLQ